MGYQRICVPLDGSLLAEYILPQVEKIASAFESEVTLLHVVPNDEVDCNTLTLSQKQTRANVVRYLQAMEDCLKKRGVKVRWSIRCGDPAEEIVWYVNEHHTNLVIMSTHGRGEAYQQVVGSVAAKVLEKVGIPIMLMKVPENMARL